MPNVQSLLDQAAVASTSNPPSCYVSATWPTLWSGLSPAEHGRSSPGYIGEGTFEVHRRQLADIKATPFWTALAQAGRRAAVIDVPHSLATPIGDGVQIVNWGTHDRPRTKEPVLPPDLQRHVGEHPVFDCDDYTRRGAFADLTRDLLSGVDRKAELSERVLAQSNLDFFFVVFGEGHCVGHQCWHIHDAEYPTHDPSVAAAVGDPIVAVYEQLDLALGRILASVDSSATVVLLLSHGMGPHYDGSWAMDEILRRLDHLWGEPPRLVVARERLRRGIRRLLLRARPPARAAMQRQLDGSRRFVRAPNSSTDGAIRLNVRGREPAGRVSAGAEFDDVCAALERELLALVNVETGEPAVRAVWRATEEFDGPAVRQMPDLFVEWNRSKPIYSLESEHIGRIDGGPGSPRSGDHYRDGLIAVRGPSIAAGRFDPIASSDVASTLCALVGVDFPAGTPASTLMPSSHSSPAHR
jgi:predicted AlkP superfamily phosphohydrolase/phosphomutase